jgi:glyceraldehyde-3-phosphate dehydrogenase/erythrose-4-phosphate dehydrogenase
LQVKVAINGFGRIGRNFMRCLETRTDSLLDVVAINDSGGVKQASHLLKYDSTLGKFDADVKIVDDSHISINGKKVSSRSYGSGQLPVRFAGTRCTCLARVSQHAYPSMAAGCLVELGRGVFRTVV